MSTILHFCSVSFVTALRNLLTVSVGLKGKIMELSPNQSFMVFPLTEPSTDNTVNCKAATNNHDIKSFSKSCKSNTFEQH